MNRIYYILLLVGLLGMASCSSDDPLESSAPDGELAEFDEDGDQEQNQEKEQEQETVGYKSKLLAPPGFERGVGYSYATGAEYLEGVTFNIFNLNYLDSIQYVKGLNFVSDDYTPYSEEQVITKRTGEPVRVCHEAYQACGILP